MRLMAREAPQFTGNKPLRKPMVTYGLPNRTYGIF